MNPRTTSTLLVLALALLAFVFFVERPMREAKLRQTSHKMFARLNPAEIKSVQIQPAGQPIIRAERSNEIWRLTKPLAYSADAVRIAAFLQNLTQLEWQTRLSAQDLQDRPNAQEEFGFLTPQFSLTLNDGKFRLNVGAASAMGDQVFLQTGSDEIFLASGELLKSIPRRGDDWRDATVASLDNFQFDSITVRSAGKNFFELQRDPVQHLWRMNKPLQARADNTKIEDALKKLQALRAVDFVTDDPKADLETYGLQTSPQTPALELSFSNSTATNVAFSLQAGASPTNFPETIFARRQNPPNIFRIAKEPLKVWQSDYTSFLDRHLVSLPASLIDEIGVDGDESFSLQRTNGGWLVASKEKFPADAEFMDTILASLTNVDVEIEKTVVADSDLASYGLAKPALRLKIISSSPPTTNSTTAEIEFGTNQTGKVFERRADEPSVNIISREAFDRLPRAAWQLRDRHIWNFESNNVAAITIHQKGFGRKMIRDLQNEWTFAPGFAGLINIFSLEETLHRLGELKAVFWSGRGDQNLERFGFKETDHRIALEIKRDDKTETLSIDFGKASPYLHPYAMVQLDGQRWIFEFPVDLYREYVQPNLSIPPAFRTRRD